MLAIAMLIGGAVAIRPSTPAAAQDVSASELEAARSLYEQGLRHARAGRWQEAREAFGRSLDISERPSTLLNFAGALVETSELVAAIAGAGSYSGRPLSK